MSGGGAGCACKGPPPQLNPLLSPPAVFVYRVPEFLAWALGCLWEDEQKFIIHAVAFPTLHLSSAPHGLVLLHNSNPAFGHITPLKHQSDCELD